MTEAAQRANNRYTIGFATSAVTFLPRVQQDVILSATASNDGLEDHNAQTVRIIAQHKHTQKIPNQLKEPQTKLHVSNDSSSSSTWESNAKHAAQRKKHAKAFLRLLCQNILRASGGISKTDRTSSSASPAKCSEEALVAAVPEGGKLAMPLPSPRSSRHGAPVHDAAADKDGQSKATRAMVRRRGDAPAAKQR